MHPLDLRDTKTLLDTNMTSDSGSPAEFGKLMTTVAQLCCTFQFFKGLDLIEAHADKTELKQQLVSKQTN